MIRQLKIDLITDNPNPIIEWFNDLWNSLEVVQVKVFHHYPGECVYYNKSTIRAIFYLDTTDGRILYDYVHYSELFYNQGFDYVSNAELEQITEILLSSVFDHKWAVNASQTHLNRLVEINRALSWIQKQSSDN